MLDSPRSLVAALALAVILGPASDAVALGLIPLAIERSVFQEGTELCAGCGRNGHNPSSASEVTNCELESFDEMVAGIGSMAMQTSFLSPDELFGTGKIELGSTTSNSAHSSLLVHFKVEETGLYGLFGGFFGQATTNEMSLASSRSRIFDRVSTGAENFFESFRLEAGETYRLEAKVWGQDFSGVPSGGGWAFDVVPEPNTGSLLGLGLVALGLGRRARAA